ncbi:MAG: hypothetical protein K8F60_16290 [Melioribacteraceae bacterium]|nr:hypothetical protein [Melioribacteraceae bacterium]
MNKPNYLAVWIYLLTSANHKEKEIIWNNEKVIIKRGQFIGSLQKLSNHFNLGLGTVSRIISYLEKENMIERKSTNKFTLFTIVNYDFYQSENFSEMPKTETKTEIKNIEESLINKGLPEVEESKREAERKASGKQAETNNNDNNENNGLLKKIYTPEKLIFDLWNEQEIITHNEKTFSRFSSIIKTTLKNYSYEEIKTAIINYSLIVKNDEYYFSYKWTLKEFLSRGLDKFSNLNTAKENFTKNEYTKSISRDSKEYTYQELLDISKFYSIEQRKEFFNDFIMNIETGLYTKKAEIEKNKSKQRGATNEELARIAADW